MASRTRHDFASGAILTSAQLDALPAGWLGYKLQTNALGGVTNSEATIPELQETVTWGAGRILRLAAEISVESTVALDEVRIRIVRDTDVQLARDFGILLANKDQGHHVERLWETPSAGSGLFKVTVERVTGSGTITVQASSNLVGSLIIQDLGSA